MKLRENNFFVSSVISVVKSIVEAAANHRGTCFRISADFFTEFPRRR
jgi:hypothetical protein